MEINSAVLGLIFSGVGVATLLIIIFGSRGSKDKEHQVMDDVEMLGRPSYRPDKHRLQEEQNPLVQLKLKESKKPLPYTDIEYERDEKDWWWCEDV